MRRHQVEAADHATPGAVALTCGEGVPVLVEHALSLRGMATARKARSAASKDQLAGNLHGPQVRAQPGEPVLDEHPHAD